MIFSMMFLPFLDAAKSWSDEDVSRWKRLCGELRLTASMLTKSLTD